jgi:hypothetical protein
MTGFLLISQAGRALGLSFSGSFMRLPFPVTLALSASPIIILLLEWPLSFLCSVSSVSRVSGLGYGLLWGYVGQLAASPCVVLRIQCVITDNQALAHWALNFISCLSICLMTGADVLYKRFPSFQFSLFSVSSRR